MFRNITKKERKDNHVPPAWKNVEMAVSSRNKIKIKGVDVKGKYQYIYNQNWIEKASKKKFYRLKHLIKDLPSIKNKLRNPSDSKEKLIVLILKILMLTYIRIGNDTYEKENKTYGLTTMNKKHCKIDGNIVEFTFIGKKGKIQNIRATLSKKMRDNLIRLRRIPGKYLFQYNTPTGVKKIKALDINDYIVNVLKKNYTCKDFRTYGANKEFHSYLCKKDEPIRESEINRNILDAIEYTSIKLGNTKSICRKSYISPNLIDNYKKDPVSFKRRKIINLL